MTRVYIDKQSPSVYRAFSAAAAEVRARAEDAGLSRTTIELVNIRVSQLNRCPFCLNLHSQNTLENGEAPQRLAVLPAWRETTLFSAVERAALEIAETVTLVAGGHLTDAEYARVREHLTDDQISLLIWAAITINTFNRVSIMSGHPVRRAPAPDLGEDERVPR